MKLSAPARLAWTALSLLFGGCATYATRPSPSVESLRQLKSVNGFAFSKDMRTAYVALLVDEKDARGRGRARIFARDLKSDGWGAPRALPFSVRHTDYQPVMSADGRNLYFTSTRPISPDGPELRQNVWKVPVHDGAYGTPVPMTELNAEGWDGHAVATTSGTIYFASDRIGQQTDIWFSKPRAGRLSAPINLAAVNGRGGESDLYVDPGERYLIFGRYDEATKEIELFASVRRKGAWLPARALAMVNRPGYELSPTVTPDGRWFLLQRDGEVQVYPWRDVRRYIESLFRH